ncbi:MAG: hypothetical protein AAGP08_12995 [Pseudomonadota bacterium]
MRFVLALMLFALPVSAEEFIDTDGVRYDGRCNIHGYVLLSPTEDLYLGRSCDVFFERLGEGEWCWDDAGFTATFAEAELAFGDGQKLTCFDPEIENGCQCGADEP